MQLNLELYVMLPLMWVTDKKLIVYCSCISNCTMLLITWVTDKKLVALLLYLELRNGDFELHIM